MEVKTASHFDPPLADDPLTPDLAAEGFAALGSESRLGVLAALVRAGDQGLPTGVLSARCGVGGSTLTHHIKSLVQAGIVTQKRDGRQIVCRANFETLDKLSKFLLRECCVDQAGIKEEDPNV